jgi:hypothetical protein
MSRYTEVSLMVQIQQLGLQLMRLPLSYIVIVLLDIYIIQLNDLFS